MALTREERQAIQELIKRVRKSEQRLDDLEKRLATLQTMVGRIDAEENMADWSSEQWQNFLAPFLQTFSTSSSYVPKHDHKNDRTGGPCFARLGANLINGEDVELGP